MLSGEKILITGPAGAVTSEPVAASLAADNEVWGLARFGDPAVRARIEGLGITTRSVDLAAPDFSDVPDDFTYVLHYAHTRMGPGDFIPAVQVNGVGAGLVLQHCRKAKAALVVSSAAVYSAREGDPYHAFHEGDDIGRSFTPWAPTSPASKVSLEAIARFSAEAFELPVTIARVTTAYGPGGGMPIMHMDAVVAGDPVISWALPYPQSPIHSADMCDQVEALLDAASSPATIVNWAGDEIVSVEDWCEQVAQLSGRKADVQLRAVPGAQCGAVADITLRKSITGPCRRVFRDEFEKLYHARHGAG